MLKGKNYNTFVVTGDYFNGVLNVTAGELVEALKAGMRVVLEVPAETSGDVTIYQNEGQALIFADVEPGYYAFVFATIAYTDDQTPPTAVSFKYVAESLDDFPSMP